MMVRSWQEMQPYLVQLQAVEAECFATSAWDLMTWERLFANRKLFVSMDVQQELLTGFAVAAQGADEGELLRIGVREQWRRKGVGGRLLENIIQTLGNSGIATLYLEVREDNQPAVEFYRQCGCEQTGRRNNYYSQPVGDALLFSYHIKPISNPFI